MTMEDAHAREVEEVQDSSGNKKTCALLTDFRKPTCHFDLHVPQYFAESDCKMSPAHGSHMELCQSSVVLYTHWKCF